MVGSPSERSSKAWWPAGNWSTVTALWSTVPPIFPLGWRQAHSNPKVRQTPTIAHIQHTSNTPILHRPMCTCQRECTIPCDVHGFIADSLQTITLISSPQNCWLCFVMCRCVFWSYFTASLGWQKMIYTPFFFYSIPTAKNCTNIYTTLRCWGSSFAWKQDPRFIRAT